MGSFDRLVLPESSAAIVRLLAAGVSFQPVREHHGERLSRRTQAALRHFLCNAVGRELAVIRHDRAECRHHLGHLFGPSAATTTLCCLRSDATRWQLFAPATNNDNARYFHFEEARRRPE